ncbi:MAG TPA: hemerythrin domain-containing protein [Acidimicrobiia bacterium]|nr:hemerythrin domain-containing protein [Acidimicrobiia bacterium]
MTDSNLDMTMMIAFHDALRRDLQQVAAMDARSEGWDLFERMLHLHHTAEDDLLWPVARDQVAGRSEELALLEEMAAEHAAIGPVLDEFDRELNEGKIAPAVRADLDERLRQHLQHEEVAALPLIDRTLSPDQWMTFGMAAMERFRPDMPRFLPWLLDGADADVTANILKFIPPPVQQSYRDDWLPAYDARDLWATKSSVT